MKPLPPRNRLLALLRYDPEKGVFTWRGSAHPKVAGKRAGTTCRGYTRIWIDGESYAAGRLAWLIMTGEEPKGEIDHRDRNRSNNRWCNLRDVSHQTNSFNQGPGKQNPSRSVGVTRHKATGKWRAQIRRDGKCIHLGLFTDKADAEKAYGKAKAIYHAQGE